VAELGEGEGEGEGELGADFTFLLAPRHCGRTKVVSANSEVFARTTTTTGIYVHAQREGNLVL
jgi:hypothetical protein